MSALELAEEMELFEAGEIIGKAARDYLGDLSDECQDGRYDGEI
jgi:hypothetical protein